MILQAVELPKLRPVEALPVETGRGRMVALRDPWGISPEVLLSEEAFFLAAQLDGRNTLRDLQVAYMRRFGEIIFGERIEELIRTLDEHYLLETPRFQQHLQELKERWQDSPVREAAFAGKGYPADPAELRSYLEGFLEEASPRRLDGLRGVVAPHIDLGRGGPCYASVYRALAEEGDHPSLVVIFGTCHLPMKAPFALTEKAFRTPLGALRTACDLVEEIREAVPFDPLEDEFLHRNEHTVELQLLFLQHLWGDGFEILPILCRSFAHYVEGDSRPFDDPAFRAFVEALREVLRRREVLLLASADLSHIGPQFGDPLRVDEGTLVEVGGKDREMLSYVERGDAEGFYDYVKAERDRRRICGLPPIYALLKVLGSCRGELLDYRQWRDPRGFASVSFASLALF